MSGKYAIVEKFRVNFVGKVNVEHWGLFLMLVKILNGGDVWIYCVVDVMVGGGKMVLTVLQVYIYIYIYICTR